MEFYSQVIVKSVNFLEWKNSHHKYKYAQDLSLIVSPSPFPQPLPSISGQRGFLRLKMVRLDNDHGISNTTPDLMQTETWLTFFFAASSTDSHQNILILFIAFVDSTL